MCIDFHQTGSVGEGSDHLQLIKFWLSCAPGKGVCSGAKILALPYYSQHRLCLKWGCGRAKFFALPYYSQRAVFASLSAFFIYLCITFIQWLQLQFDKTRL